MSCYQVRDFGTFNLQSLSYDMGTAHFLFRFINNFNDYFQVEKKAYCCDSFQLHLLKMAGIQCNLSFKTSPEMKQKFFLIESWSLISGLFTWKYEGEGFRK